jgi:replicative DNA helicase
MDILSSEQSIIAGIMIHPDILAEIRSQLVPEDFLNERNRLLYSAILQLADNGTEIIPTSIVDMIVRKGNAGKIPTSYIADLLAAYHTSGGSQYHLKRIKENRIKTALMNLSSRIVDSKQDPISLLTETRERVSKIHIPTDATQIIHLADILGDVVDSIDHKITGAIPTGFGKLDNNITGWMPGELIIVAGRPGMGKSILAKEFAEASGVPTLFFSLEMPVSQLVKRQISAHSGVSYRSIRRSDVAAEDWDRIQAAASKLYSMPISYSDKANMSISEIAACCDAYKRDHNLGLVIIDYLQLIRADGKLEHREREVAQISQRLKTMARDLNVPVICLAQLNRACELRSDKKPQLSDLRESGAIEQDADMVIFIWREAVYFPKTRDDGMTNEHEAQLMIVKGRNTETGFVRVYFDGSRQRIRDLYTSEGGELCQA